MKLIAYILVISIMFILIFGILWLGGWNFERGPLAASAAFVWALLSISALGDDQDP